MSSCRGLPQCGPRNPATPGRGDGSVVEADEVHDVVDRARSALWWLSVALLPGAVAFAHDGILIGAGDYRFLGRAAFGYLVAVAPIAVLVLAFPSLGIAGIWGGLLCWMIIRAVVNDRRTAHVLA